MKYSEAKAGRIFILRLEDGDILHESVEAFARAQNIQAAALLALGGADQGSKLVVGPEHGRRQPVIPLEHILDNVHEVTGVGTLFPNAAGQPVLHMHLAAGRETSTITGCVRRGVKVWHVLEIVLWELTETTARRLLDSTTGFELLQP
jgi:predicted DNA-binding protein with PD1-like motif